MKTIQTACRLLLSLTCALPVFAQVTLTTDGTHADVRTQINNALTYLDNKPGAASTAQGNSACLAAWGDSLTSGAGTSTPSTQSYPAQLTALIPGTSATNGGVSGETSTQILTRFLASPNTLPCTNLLWAGRNNFGAPDTIIADLTSMVNALPTPKRFVVMSIINGSFPLEWNTVGNTALNAIIALNARMQAAWPNNYIDIRSWLVAQSPGTPEDVIDVSHNVVPSSFRTTLIEAGTLGANITTTNTCTSTPITVTYTSGSPGAGQTVTIDSEKIFANAVVSNQITDCIRGYAGTNAATHTSGATLTIRDALHLNSTGYGVVAAKVASFINVTLNATPALVQYSQVPQLFATPGAIGAAIPAPGTFTTATATNLVLNGGSPDSSSITGSFTETGPTVRWQALTNECRGCLVYFLTSAGGGSAVLFPSGSGAYLQLGGSGFLPQTDAAEDLGLNTTSTRWRNGYFSGIVSAPNINYIGTENGANNAIACAAGSGPALTAGLRVTVQLAHSLQAGANQFNYLAGGLLNIRKGSDPTANITTALTSGGVADLLYNGTLWLLMTQ